MATNETLSPNPQPAELPALPPDALVVIPVRGAVLFPGSVMPITVGRARSVAAAQAAVQRELPVGLLLQRDPAIEDPAGADLHQVGTVGAVLRYLTAPDGAHHLVCQGQHRFRVLDFLPGYPFLVARVERIGESEVRTPELEARLLHLSGRRRRRWSCCRRRRPSSPPPSRGSTPAALADLIANVMDIEPAEKQDVLETFDVAGAHEARLGAARPSHRGAAAVAPDQPADQGDDGGPPARVPAARAAQDHPEGARRGATAKSEEIAELSEAHRRRARCRPRSRARPRRSWRGSSACRRAPPSTAWCAPISTGWSSCPGRSRPSGRIDIAEARRVLDEDHFGLRQGEAAHPRISRRAEAEARRQEPDPVLRRPARRRQDLARPEHRPRHRPQIRPRQPRRRA